MHTSHVCACVHIYVHVMGVPFKVNCLLYSAVGCTLQYYTASIPLFLPCSTADSANSVVCDVSGKKDKDEEGRKKRKES